MQYILSEISIIMYFAWWIIRVLKPHQPTIESLFAITLYKQPMKSFLFATMNFCSKKDCNVNLSSTFLLCKQNFAQIFFWRYMKLNSSEIFELVSNFVEVFLTRFRFRNEINFQWIKNWFISYLDFEWNFFFYFVHLLVKFKI